MTTKKTPAIKKSPTKAAVPKKGSARDVLIEVHSWGDTAKKPAIRKRLEELEKIEQAKLKTVREWLLDVITIAKTYNRAKTAFREAKYQIIGKVYEKYIQIESSGELRDQFYNELRKKLLEYGYKVQSNTPDAGLLLRLVLGKSPSSSSINSYVKVLYAAKESAVPQEKIVDWLRELTISGAAKQIPNYEDVRKERVSDTRLITELFGLA